VWTLQHQDLSLQKNCGNRYGANIIPAKAERLSQPSAGQHNYSDEVIYSSQISSFMIIAWTVLITF
jgi:hypothetical protein